MRTLKVSPIPTFWVREDDTETTLLIIRLQRSSCPVFSSPRVVNFPCTLILEGADAGSSAGPKIVAGVDIAFSDFPEGVEHATIFKIKNVNKMTRRVFSKVRQFNNLRVGLLSNLRLKDKKAAHNNGLSASKD